MDNIGIVVESLDDAVAVFTALGLACEGRGADQTYAAPKNWTPVANPNGRLRPSRTLLT